MEADFSGYATRYNVKCADGRTIKPGAFAHMDGVRVPLMWQHRHDSPENVLGHAVLSHRDDGVFIEGFFNETEEGRRAREIVRHGDVNALSIFANKLKEKAKEVWHGFIREVSLVPSGANPGAYIEYVSLAHDEDGSDVGEAFIFTDDLISLTNNLAHEEKSVVPTDATVKDVFETLNEEQKTAVFYILGEALEAQSSAEHSGMSEDTEQDTEQDHTIEHGSTNNQEQNMTRNVFDTNGVGATGEQTRQRPTLSHSQLQTIVEDAKKMGSFKDSFLAHAVEYGIENIDLLFPDAKAISNTPELISRRMPWVNTVLSGVRKSPFSRIKNLFADITQDEARAKGYIKGTLKKEEWFGLTKRVTTPTTVYKKQKLDRDDIIDITDLDVVAWLKGEMRLMLDEELARAILIGDGREVDDEDKVKEPASGSADGVGIRSIANDADFFAHKVTLEAQLTGDDIVEAILRARPKYRGAGNPTMYCTEDFLTDLMLIKDRLNRRVYQTQEDLERALRVSGIETVDVMEGATTDQGQLLAILVNLNDYTVGADRGGETSFFDDFDIDYNQYKYLYEARMSGALTKYKSALVISRESGTIVTPTVPGFNASTGVVTIPSVTGVVYRDQETLDVLSAGAQTALDPSESWAIQAIPATGYYFPHNFDADWTFTRNAA